MGGGAVNKLTKVTTFLSDRRARALKEAAARHEMTVSALVRLALVEWLECEEKQWRREPPASER
jgi:hypothetical protein